jgi:hypothetical protein
MPASDSIADRLGMERIEKIPPELRYGIESLLPSQHFVKLSQLMQRQVGKARLVFGQVSCQAEGEGSGASRTVRQSFAYFEQSGLGLPSALLQPKTVTSPLFSTMLALAGMSTINLGSSPDAARTMTGVSMQPAAAGRLLTSDVLDVLGSKQSLALKTEEDRMLVYRSGHTFPDDELAGFVDDSREIFQAVHRRAVELPELAAEAQAEAIATIQNLSGPIGALLRSRFVPQGEVDAFLIQPPPRKIPKSIVRQRVGWGSAAVYMIGIALIGIGGTVTAMLATTPDIPRWGIALCGLLPLLGAGTIATTYWYRRTQKRLLRSGSCCDALVTAVKGTSVFVNSQRRYKVTMRVDEEGDAREVTINAYEPAVKRAFSLLSSGRLTRVLIDPRNSDRLFWIDALPVV